MILRSACYFSDLSLSIQSLPRWVTPSAPVSWLAYSVGPNLLQTNARFSHLSSSIIVRDELGYDNSVVCDQHLVLPFATLHKQGPGKAYLLRDFFGEVVESTEQWR